MTLSPVGSGHRQRGAQMIDIAAKPAAFGADHRFGGQRRKVLGH